MTLMRIYLLLVVALLCFSVQLIQCYDPADQVLIKDDTGTHEADNCLFQVNTTATQPEPVPSYPCTNETEAAVCERYLNDTRHQAPNFYSSGDPTSLLIYTNITIADGCACINGQLNQLTDASFFLVIADDLNEIEWAEVLFNEWEWYPAGSSMNRTESYYWLSDPAPWKPPYWGVGAEDYFLFSVFGMLLMILFAAFLHWACRRCKTSPPDSYATV